MKNIITFENFFESASPTTDIIITDGPLSYQVKSISGSISDFTITGNLKTKFGIFNMTIYRSEEGGDSTYTDYEIKKQTADLEDLEDELLELSIRVESDEKVRTIVNNFTNSKNKIIIGGKTSI